MFYYCNIISWKYSNLISYSHTVLPWTVPALYPLVQIAHHGSVCTTLAVATERFLSVCRPERLLSTIQTLHVSHVSCACGRYVPSYSGHVANLVIFCFTLIFNLPRFFELSVEQHSECGLNILRVGPSR